MQERINIGGENRPIKFNYRAIKAYELETGESYLGVVNKLSGSQPSVTALVGLAYAGLVGGGNEYDIEEVAEWVMKMEEKDISRLFKLFVDSFPKKDTDDVKQPNEGKRLGE